MNKGININYLDRQVRPGDNFYQFVNGGWLRETDIPDDRASWGSFHELAKHTDEKVLAILDEELKEAGPSANKAARLFESGMNIKQIEKQKLEGLKSFLEKTNFLSNAAGISALSGLLNPKGLAPFILLSVHPDLGDSKKYAAYLEPSPLGLPEREFYLEEDDKAKDIRAKYIEYLHHIFKAECGLTDKKAEEFSMEILNLEMGLARHMMPKEKRRQIELLYNPHSFHDLSNRYPLIDWTGFFNSMELDHPDYIIVTDTEYFEFLNTSITELPAEVVKYYFKFTMMHRAAPFSHAGLEEKHFDLFSRHLEGIEKMRPRNERIVKIVNQFLGEALGQLFVSKHFPPTAKATALEMVDDIVRAFRNRISRLEWMSEKTREYALEKLSSFRVKIGYPDTWKSYEDLHLSASDTEGSYLENLIAVAEWKFRRDSKRIHQPVDREEWFMAPQVVNAYYNPMFNEIVFPAAILQPPFFDWEADAAVNYGGIGAVIGHEITHGFDDQGSRFDKDGNLNEWWSAEDRERFNALTKQLIDQFNGYYPFEDLSLNGTFTLGENIADLGGLSVAYDALQLYFERHGKPEPIDGFTPEQRFFMSWATVWRTKIRPEALRTQIKVDPHPPGMYRAVAAPSNLNSFYSAFEIFPESPWYRKKEERIKIW